ncbi:MAG: hypothetical protein R2855_08660 [Thermomicrobiales bacterium]
MPDPQRTPAPRHAWFHPGLIATLVLALLALTQSPTGIAAQSATPVAANACADPGLVPAPDVPEGVSASTPSALYGVDVATGDAIQSVIEALASCLTAGDAETVTVLVTDRYLADAYGGGERMTKEDYLALAPSAAVIPVTVVSIGQINFTGSDTASAQVITVQGNQLRTEEWTFLFRPSRSTAATPTAAGEGHWLVHQVALQTPSIPSEATQATATETDGKITISPATIAGPDVVFTVKNTGDEAHEFLVLRLVDGATIEELIRPTGDGFPDNMQVIGQETIPAGESRSLVFVDLAPGEYTVVCLLPDADGVPHLALGESATFMVS